MTCRPRQIKGVTNNGFEFHRIVDAISNTIESFFVRHQNQLPSYLPFMHVAGAKQYLDSLEGNIELQLGSVREKSGHDLDHLVVAPLAPCRGCGA